MTISFEDKKPLGRTGETISAIGLGTWDIKNSSSAIDALAYGVELGMNMIDTAEMYGSGKAELIVGEVIKHVSRERVFITTKLMPDKFLDEDRALRAMKLSLDRLGVSEADLLLIHWYEPYLNAKNMIHVLERIADAGYTRYIGVSNFDLNLLRISLENVRRYEIVVNQVRYNVHDKSIEHDLLPFMIREGITIQAYTPLERGRVARDRFLAEIGDKYGKSSVQIALNYLISHENVTAIPKTEREKRVKEFYGALGWRLKPEDIEIIKMI